MGRRRNRQRGKDRAQRRAQTRFPAPPPPSDVSATLRLPSFFRLPGGVTLDFLLPEEPVVGSVVVLSGVVFGTADGNRILLDGRDPHGIEKSTLVMLPSPTLH